MTLLEDWCKVCDALEVSPDTGVENVINKAKTLQRERARLNKINADLLAACEQAEQTLRNLSNEWHDFDARQISMNEAANLQQAIAKARGETST